MRARRVKKIRVFTALTLKLRLTLNLQMILAVTTLVPLRAADTVISRYLYVLFVILHLNIHSQIHLHSSCTAFVKKKYTLANF